MSENQKLKILLAEDNMINQRIMMLTFKQLGVACDVASNGKEACDLYQQKLYDLILMDMQMPVMDGLEATIEIRAIEEKSQIKHRVFIVALTASTLSEKKDACLAAGMDDFMEKPLQSDLLLELFARLK